MIRQSVRRAVRGNPVTARALGEYRVQRARRPSAPQHAEISHAVANIAPRSTFLDIGADVGDFSLAAQRKLRRNGSVLALEPNPHAYHDLRRATAGTSITTVNVAASDKPGHARLSVPTNSALGSLERVFEGGFAYTVRTVRVDDLTDHGRPPVSVIKIDVEGHERQVLDGAWATIDRDRPALVIEIEQRHLTHGSVADVIAPLLERGYVCDAIQPNGLLPWSEFDVEEHQTQWLQPGLAGRLSAGAYLNNFLLTPRS